MGLLGRGNGAFLGADTLSGEVDGWVVAGRKSGPMRRRYNDFP